MRQVQRLFTVGLLIQFLLFGATAKADDDLEESEAAWKLVTFDVKTAMELRFDRAMRQGRIYSYPNLGCYQNELGFDACVMALQHMGALMTPKVTVIPSTDLAHEDWQGAKVVGTYGPLSLVEAPEARQKKLFALKPQARVAMVVSDRDSVLAVAKQALLESQKDGPLPVDFHSLAEKIKAMRPAAVPEGKVAVALYSGFNLAIDAHSHLDLKTDIQNKTKEADLSMTGIGVEVEEADEALVVRGVMTDGPSTDKLRAGDVILQADGVALKGLTIDQAVAKLRGKADTRVNLDILRGKEAIAIQITRAKVTRKNVEVSIHNDMGPKIALIRLGQFSDENGCDRIRDAIKAKDAQVTGYVLDLRGNPGGLLTQSACIGQLFAGRMPIAYEKNLRSGEIKSVPEAEDYKDAVTSKPMTVLIDGGSASASEIVSGALQGLGRAWVVGDRSFGKASVQVGGEFPFDPNLVQFFTIARFYVPVADGSKLTMRTNQRVGVVPDFLVLRKPNMTDDEAFSMREGDYYPYALTAETKSWDELRPGPQAVIQKCLDQGKRADKLYESRRGYDYQLLKAEEVLSCQATPSTTSL